VKNMEIEKYIAALLASLMAVSTFVGAALASDLSGFPEFLFAKTATASSPAYLVVVGADAKTSDVVGAIDLASRLAEGSYTIEKIAVAPAAPTVEGKEGKVNFGGYVDDKIGTELTATQIPALFRGELTYNSDKFSVVEKIVLANDQIKVGYERTPKNGSAYVDLTATEGQLKYVYDFIDKFNATKEGISKSKPLTIKLFGEEFKISAVGTDSFTALKGVTGTATATTPVTYGDYSIYSDLGSDGKWARIIIKDKAGNTVDTLVIDQGITKDSTAAKLSITVSTVRALADGTIVGVELVVGPVGAVEKTYSDGDYFPGTDLWKFNVVTEGSDTLDAIELIYRGGATNETYRYLVAGEKVIAPNNYFELGFSGFDVTKFATLEASSSRINVFASPTATSAFLSNRPSVIITVDYPTFKLQETGKVALVNTTEGIVVAYWDASVEKWINATLPLNSTRVTLPAVDATATYSFDGGSYVVGSTASGYNETLILNGAYDAHSFRITLFERGKSAPFILSDLSSFKLVDGGSTEIAATWNYSAPDDVYILGAKKGEAEASDIKQAGTDIGTWEHNSLTLYGSEVQNVKTNAGADKLVVKLPAEQQAAIVYVGKLGAAVAPGEVTYNKVAPIKTAVAKLDTEVTDAMKAAYHIVTVGGPCINKITAAAMNLTYPACGAASTIPENAAIIEVKDDVFTSGKVVVIVAGWEADNTRLACSVLQNYDAYKSQFGTAKKVKITGTIAAPSITPA